MLPPSLGLETWKVMVRDQGLRGVKEGERALAWHLGRVHCLTLLMDRRARERGGVQGACRERPKNPEMLGSCESVWADLWPFWSTQRRRALGLGWGAWRWRDLVLPVSPSLPPSLPPSHHHLLLLPLLHFV